MHAQHRGRGRSGDGQEARARVERAWGARTAHLLSILADAHASQPQPASPRPGTAAPTRFRRGDVGLVHPAASPSSGEGSEEDQVDAAHRCGARDSQPGRGQQAAAPSSRQPAPASRGLHGGRSRQLAEARSASGTWRPWRRRRRRSDRGPPCPVKTCAYHLNSNKNCYGYASYGYASYG